MTRKNKQCERVLIELLSEAYNCYKRYYPNGDYLSVAFINDGLTIFNEYWERDEDFPIDTYHSLKKVD